jgi:hypothetical protein
MERLRASVMTDKGAVVRRQRPNGAPLMRVCRYRMAVRSFCLLTFAYRRSQRPRDRRPHCASRFRTRTSPPRVPSRPTTRCAPSAKSRIVASRPPSTRKRTSWHYSRTTGTAASGEGRRARGTAGRPGSAQRARHGLGRGYRSSWYSRHCGLGAPAQCGCRSHPQGDGLRSCGGDCGRWPAWRAPLSPGVHG